jgi:hypothetical protein
MNTRFRHTLFAALTTALSAPAYSAIPADYTDILKPVEHVNVALPPGATPDNDFRSLRFRADGVDYALLLEPDAQANNVNVRWIGLDTPPPSPPITYYKGRVEHDPSTWARIALQSDGQFRGMLWQGNEAYFFQPTSDFDKTADTSATVMYRLADTPPSNTPISCGLDEQGNTVTPKNGMEELNQIIAELHINNGRIDTAMVADYEYYKIWGEQAGSRLITFVTQLDGLMHAATGVSMWGTELLVYTQPNQQPFSNTTSPNSLLQEFSALRSDPKNPGLFNSGIAHLITGKDLDGSIAGIAYLGGICRGDIASSLSMHYTAWDSAQMALIAHEIAHGFNARHDGQTPCESVGPGYIMWQALLSSNALSFSQCSIDSMLEYIKTSNCIITNFPPIAKAGHDEWIWGAQTIELDARFSTDDDGDLVRWQWEQIGGDNIGFKPSTLERLSLSIPAIPDSRASRTFKFRLTVEDDDGAQSSDEKIVTQYAGANKPPVANAGPDITIVGPQNVPISASLSYDPDGLELDYYEWKQLSGNPVNIANYLKADATLLFREQNTIAQTYTFQLTVTDKGGLKASDTFTVTQKPLSANLPPVANAGNDLTVSTNQDFTLDGGASYDPDGTITQYAWSTGHTGRTAITRFNSAGTYTVKLTVTDNLGVKSSDDLVVTVKDSGFSKNYPLVYARGSFNNWGLLPMALIANNTWQAKATFGTTTTERFKFDASGNWQTNFGDTNKDGTAERDGADIPITGGTGTYTLTFNDSTFKYTAIKDGNSGGGNNITPIADAGPDVNVITGTAVSFDGSASRDPDGTITRYEWTSPAFGSTVLNGVKPSFTFSNAGDYTVTLKVTDNGNQTATDTLLVKVSSVPNEPSNWKPTAIMIYGETVVGQDMFIRGGIDWDYAKTYLGRNCSSDKWQCAIPIKHKIQSNDKIRSGDTFLDWYGAEAAQGSVEGSPLAWTTNAWPASWGTKRTVVNDGYGETPWNTWGHHYWLLYVDMDCTKTVNGWFELKAFISNGPGWENNISQPGAPYKSVNHFAQCGKMNVFRRGQNDPVTISDIPGGSY